MAAAGVRRCLRAIGYRVRKNEPTSARTCKRHDALAIDSWLLGAAFKIQLIAHPLSSQIHWQPDARFSMDPD